MVNSKEEGYHYSHEPHTLVIVLFRLAMVKVELSKVANVTDLFEDILRSEEYNLPLRVHEIAKEYKSSRHLRYCIPTHPFPVKLNEVPRVANISPITSIPRTTCGCFRLPTDGSVVNLVVEEPLPLMEMTSPTTREIFSSREVVQFMLAHGAELYPVSSYGSTVSGYLGEWSNVIFCKHVNEHELSIFQELESLSPKEHHIATLALPPLSLPTGRYIIAMPFYGDNLVDVEGKDLSGDIILKITRQLCDAVQQLHRHQYCHLDIKPENLALSENTSDLTLIDLGLVTKTPTPTSFFRMATGTSGWVAPQVQLWHDYETALEYGRPASPPPSFSPRRADIWAIGTVILYLLDKDGVVVEPKTRAKLTTFAKWLSRDEDQKRPLIDQAVGSLNKNLGHLGSSSVTTPLNDHTNPIPSLHYLMSYPLAK